MTRNDSQPGRPAGGPRRGGGNRGNGPALIAVIVLAVALFWLVTAMVKHNAVQNCIDSGRRDCVALPTDSGQ